MLQTGPYDFRVQMSKDAFTVRLQHSANVLETVLRVLGVHHDAHNLPVPGRKGQRRGSTGALFQTIAVEQQMFADDDAL